MKTAAQIDDQQNEKGLIQYLLLKEEILTLKCCANQAIPALLFLCPKGPA